MALITLPTATWTLLPLTKAAIVRHKSGNSPILYSQDSSIPNADLSLAKVFDESAIGEKVFINGVADGNSVYAYSVNGPGTVAVTAVESSAAPDGVYTGERAITQQPYTEANVKKGVQFTLTTEISIPTGETVYLSLTTPDNDNDTLIKTRLINTDGGMRYTPHGSATYTPDAATIPVVNLNEKSSNISQITVNTVTPINVTDEGPFFDVVRSTNGVGANREQGIFSGLGIERVLKRNSKYLLKFENLDNKAIFVVYSLTWYEGGLDLPLPA